MIQSLGISRGHVGSTWNWGPPPVWEIAGAYPASGPELQALKNIGSTGRSVKAEILPHRRIVLFLLALTGAGLSFIA